MNWDFTQIGYHNQTVPFINYNSILLWKFDFDLQMPFHNFKGAFRPHRFCNYSCYWPKLENRFKCSWFNEPVKRYTPEWTGTLLDGIKSWYNNSRGQWPPLRQNRQWRWNHQFTELSGKISLTSSYFLNKIRYHFSAWEVHRTNMRISNYSRTVIDISARP